MQGFQGQGYKVLSSNHTEHIEMVKNGDYAYIVDNTAAVIFISENCECTVAPEQFTPALYSLALQLNSAYTYDVTKV